MKTAITAFITTLTILIPALACGANSEPTQTPAARTQPTARPTVASLNPLPTNIPTPIGNLAATIPATTPSASASVAVAVPVPTPTISSDASGNPSNQQTAVPPNPGPTPTPDSQPTPTSSTVGLAFRPTATPTPTPTAAPPPTPLPTPEYYSAQFTEADYQQAVAGLPETPESRPVNHCFPLRLVVGHLSDNVFTYDSTPDGIKDTPNYRHILDALYDEDLQGGQRYQQPAILTQHYRDQVIEYYKREGYEGRMRVDGCAQFEVMHPEVPVVRYLWNFHTKFIHNGQSVNDYWSLQAYFIVENAPELDYTGRPYKARLVTNPIDAAIVNNACELAMPLAGHSCP